MQQNLIAFARDRFWLIRLSSAITQYAKHAKNAENAKNAQNAKNQESFVYMKSLFKNRKIKKEYIAIVHGSTPDKGIIDAPIGRHPKNKIKRKCNFPEGPTYFSVAKITV